MLRMIAKAGAIVHFGIYWIVAASDGDVRKAQLAISVGIFFAIAALWRSDE